MGNLVRVFLVYALGHTLVTILLALGISFASYSVIDTAVNAALDYASGLYMDLPADMIAILGLAGVPSGLSVIASATVTASMIQSARLFVTLSR